MSDAAGDWCSQLTVAVCAVPVLGWIAIARSQGIAPVNAVGKAAGAPVRPFNLRQFLSYVWQFYLPRLPGMSPDRVTSGLPVYDIWLRQGWGVFGWLELWMPEAVYVLLAGVHVAGRDRQRGDRGDVS